MAEPERLNATEARGGKKTGTVRWVLLISTLLAVLGMWYAFARTPEEGVEGNADSYREANSGLPNQPGQQRAPTPPSD